jgi:hypothetical protein
MRLVRFYCIDWDTSSEEDETPVSAAALGLPEEVIRQVDDDVDLEEEGASLLSDEYGYCVNAVWFELLEDEADCQEASSQ